MSANRQTLNNSIGVAETNKILGAPSSSSFEAIQYVPALTTMLGAWGSIEDQKQQNEALLSNMRSAGISLEFSQHQQAQQLEDLRALAGDMLSETGFNAMVTEARLKAASAETGATGTSNQEAILTAEVNRLHQDSAIMRDYKTQQSSSLTALAGERLQFSNDLTSMRSGQRSSLSAALNTFNTSLQGFNSGLTFLNVSEQERLFNTNTTGSTA